MVYVQEVLAVKGCVIIPAYNEEMRIGHIAGEVKSNGLDCIVIDDGSADNTAVVAKEAGAIVIKQPANMGKGAALRDGFARVVKDGFDRVVVLDGDGQHMTADIDAFFKKMDETGADIVIGNRMLDTSSMPLVRDMTNRFMSWLISAISHQHVHDSQCGFRLIKRIVLENVSLDSSRFEIETELIVKAAKAGFKIESVPIQTIYEGGKSRINPVVDTWRFIVFLEKTTLGR